MRQLFSQNPFGRLAQPGALAVFDEGLAANLHFACEFEPGAGAHLFAEHLKQHLHDGGIQVFSADLRMASAEDHLVKLLTRSFIQAFAGDLRKIEAVLKKLIPTATPRVVMGDTPHIDIDYGTDLLKLFTNLLDVPEIMGMEENRRAVVIWTGFERIEETLGQDGVRRFLEKAKGHAITSHILVGTGLHGIAAQLGGAMLNQVKMMAGSELVGHAAMTQWLTGEFSANGSPIKNETAEAIIRAADNRLQTVCAIGYAVERLAGKMPEALIVDQAVNDVLLGAGTAYERLWELLNPRQRGALFGLVTGGDKTLYSEAFIKEFGFKTATNLQAAIRALNAKGILYKRDKRWVFADPLFSRWIERLAS